MQTSSFFTSSALLLLGAHRFRGTQTLPDYNFTLGYHITVLPLVQERRFGCAMREWRSQNRAL
jgi:hypothetical protein